MARVDGGEVAPTRSEWHMHHAQNTNVPAHARAQLCPGRARRRRQSAPSVGTSERLSLTQKLFSSDL